MSTTAKEPSFLIWGGESWTAPRFVALLKAKNIKVSTTTTRTEDRAAVLETLTKLKPTHVINCTGYQGKPNVDWCEVNREKTIRSNVIGALNLTDCCFLNDVHITHLSSGCYYQYDDDHPIGGPGFKETDPPNFKDSLYSDARAHAEAVLKYYPNTLILRLRMPVSDDLHSRSFITKITSYPKIRSLPNSQVILHDMLPCAVILAQHNEVGVYNFANPGAISHDEILAMFKRIVRPGFVWENFDEEGLKGVTVAGRSNCVLDVTKLVVKMGEFGVEVPEIRGAYEACFRRMVDDGIC